MTYSWPPTNVHMLASWCRYIIPYKHTDAALSALLWMKINSFDIIWLPQIKVVMCSMTFNLLSVQLLSSTIFFYQRLEQLNQFPDFNNYLIFVLTKLKSEGKWLVCLCCSVVTALCSSMSFLCNRSLTCLFGHDSGDPMTSLLQMMWHSEYGSL